MNKLREYDGLHCIICGNTLAERQRKYCSGKCSRLSLQPPNGKPNHRPKDYSEELATRLCEQLAEGISLRTVCLADDMPDKATVFRWLFDIQEFRDQYDQAKQASALAMAEDVLYIADDGSEDTQRSKLRVDTRKWLMSKMQPKKYGDKIDMTTNGKDLPTPILGGMSALRTDDSSTEAPEAA